MLKKFLEKIKKQPELKRIIANINWLFLDKVIQMAIALFVSVWIIRYLGPEKYGVLSYAIAFVYLFSFISKLGLDSIVIREIVKNPLKKEEILGTAFFLKFVGGIVAFILSTAAIYFFKSGDNFSLRIVAVLALGFIFQSSDVIDYWFQSRVESKFIVFVRNISSVVSSLIKIFLIVAKASLFFFAGAILLESVVSSIGLIFLYVSKKENIFKWKIKLFKAKELLKDSWPLILSSVAVIIYMKIDQIMIGNMIGNKALGNYSAAVNLCEAWYFIPIIVVNSVFPAIICTKINNKDLYIKRIQMLYDFLLWAAILIAIPVSIFSGKIINFLYGFQYSQAGSILAIYIWAASFSFLGVASGSYLIAENLTKISFLRTVIGAIFNVTLNFLFIPKYGIVGSAAATFISFFVAVFSVGLFKASRKDFKMILNSFNIIRIIKFLAYEIF
jgi:O-antigen/teichoic acid export membrane protein